MAGSPKKRGRINADLIRQGETPPIPRGWSPAKGAHPPFRAAAADNTPPAKSDADFVAILGGVTAGQLDDESQAQFTSLRKLAFAFAQEVMELPLEPSDKNFSRILATKQAIATAMLTATVRVRPGDLRDKDDDGVGLLLARLKEASGEPAEEDRPLTAEEMLS